MPGVVRIPIKFEDCDALFQEIRQNLSKGRSFAAGVSELAMRQRCQLVLIHPDTSAELALVAEAVWIQAEGPSAGTGFQLVEPEESLASKLEDFVSTHKDSAQQPTTPDEDSERSGPAAKPRPRNIYDRLRSLSLREQQVLARSGTYTERIALERCFGGAVWESLLSNPQLTGAEAAKIAKKGGLPRPLIAQLLSNNAWLAVPEVQRALLGNPRLGGMEIVKVLKAMPRHALNQVPQQSAYRAAVRAAAKKLLQV